MSRFWAVPGKHEFRLHPKYGKSYAAEANQSAIIRGEFGTDDKLTFGPQICDISGRELRITYVGTVILIQTFGQK